MFEVLCAVAYKKERVLSRRLAKNAQLSEADALKQTLTKIAGNRLLADLISERQLLKQNAAEKLAAHKQKQADALAKKTAYKQPDPSAWLAWFDGATRPNPGKMGIGGLLKSPDGRTVEISFSAGHGDSNEAEFLALIAVLEEAVRIQPDKLIVYGDSRVVIDDMISTVRVGASNLQDHSEHARRLAEQLNVIAFVWVPRNRNAVADAFSQKALIERAG